MPTIEKTTEGFTLHQYNPPSSTSITGPRTYIETETVHLLPTTYFKAGNKIYEFFSVFTWMPVVVTDCQQFYRDIFHIAWTKYNETEFAEFNRYEVHRSLGYFVPVPGGGTLLYTTTDPDELELYDVTPDGNGNYWYAVICVLDDGRYCVSETHDANHYPKWGIEWPDVLIHNDGTDDIPQNTEYECECTIATDPEGLPVLYKFQFCQQYTEPQSVWTFIFGSNPVPRYVDCEDKRVIIFGSFGVRVAGVFWTLVGSLPSDLLPYGPTDKVFVYDEELNWIIFGDGINGKLPGYTDAIQIHYSNWADIETEDSLELNIQLWKVGELAVGTDYRMRVFPMTNIDGKRGYAAISAESFRLLPELAVPILVYPPNQAPNVNTYWPHFQFYGQSAEGGNLKYELQVSDDPTFTSTLQTFSMFSLPSEWDKTEYLDGEMVYFTPPESKPCLSPINKRGPYYWRARVWDVGWEMWSRWCTPFMYNVEGATFRWRIGLPMLEKPFLPAKDGWHVEIQQIGREKSQKKVFRVTMAAMTEQQYEILKAEFDRRCQLSLWDNMGDNYTVYWGECERALDGTAFFPNTPAFGIEQRNHIPGALRYWGECVFTEV